MTTKHILTICLPILTLMGCSDAPQTTLDGGNEAFSESRPEANKQKEAKLIQAAKDGNVATIKQLLAESVNVDARDSNGWTALIHAAGEGHLDVIRTLITNGADVNAKNDYGFTALMGAAGFGSTEIVRLLISRKADIHAKDDTGYTALDEAKQERQTEVISLLKTHGAKNDFRA